MGNKAQVLDLFKLYKNILTNDFSKAKAYLAAGQLHKLSNFKVAHTLPSIFLLSFFLIINGKL